MRDPLLWLNPLFLDVLPGGSTQTQTIRVEIFFPTENARNTTYKNMAMDHNTKHGMSLGKGAPREPRLLTLSIGDGIVRRGKLDERRLCN